MISSRLRAMNWIKVFSTESEARQQIKPGAPRLLVVHGIRLCITVFSGQFCAVQNACPHNGASLSEGRVNFLGEIVCPWHGYRFDLKSGQARNAGCADLKTFPVRIDQSGLYVALY